MFEVGFSELLLIMGLALLVLGPEKLPKVVSEIGRWMGRARAMARQFREQLEDEAAESSRRQHAPPPPPPPPAPQPVESSAPVESSPPPVEPSAPPQASPAGQSDGPDQKPQA